MDPAFGHTQVSFNDSQNMLTGKWTIKNFKDIRQESFRSTFFGTVVHDFQWSLRITFVELQGHKFVYVGLTRVPSVKATVTFTIALDDSFVTGQTSSVDIDRYHGKGFVFGVEKEFHSKYLDSAGTLEVFFKISYDDMVITDQSYNWSRYGIGRDLLTTLDGKYTDVEFHVGSEIIKAHKVVITSRCRVFEAMFDSTDTVEARTGIVTITDVEPEVFRRLLQYLYTGWCGTLPAADLPFTCRLLIAADKYNLTELMSYCKNIICRLVDKNGVANILLTIDLVPSIGILEKCLRVIANTPHEQIPDLDKVLSNPTLAKLINEHGVPNGPDNSCNATVD